MMQIAFILLTALVFSIIVTPLARRTALRVGVVSMPRSRDIHIAPVPLLGGAAIYLAFLITFLFFNSRDYISEGIGILLGATLMAILGLIDDRWGMPASVKMAGQICASIILLVGGIQVYLFDVVWLNWIITIFWIVGITNAINFLDNMDGLSGGIAAISSAFFLLLSAMNNPRQVLVGTMSAALMGSSIGFLRHNFSQTKIFMGDAGSLFLGFILASLAIKLRFLSNITIITWMVPVFVLGLPIFDMGLVVVSRLRRRVNPLTTAGKDHISHRLVAFGMTRLEAVLTCYLLAGTCGMVGIYLTQARLDEAYLVAGVMAIAMVSGIAWFEYHCPAGVRRKPPATTT